MANRARGGRVVDLNPSSLSFLVWIGQVAIKKIAGAFEELVNAKRIVREIRLLRHFNHENVIEVMDILPPSSLDNFDVSAVHALRIV